MRGAALSYLKRRRREPRVRIFERASTLKSGFIGFVTFAVAMVLLITLPAAATSHHVNVRAGTLLTKTALHGFSQVDQIDMLSPSLGYALATEASNGRGSYWYYLVRTTNTGETWSVVSGLPLAHDVYPAYTDFSNTDSDPSIYFVRPSVGYVANPHGSIYVTIDAGATWRQVSVPGSSPSYGVSGSTLSVVSSRCPSGTVTSSSRQCSSVMSEYRVGATSSFSNESIPGTSSQDYEETTLLAVAPHAVQVVNKNNDAASTQSSLLITTDDGSGWRALANPCAKLMILQLVVAQDGQWLLSCFMDQGMSQGPAKLFRSWDDGQSWSTVSNDVRGTPIYYFFSGDDRQLYGAVMNPAGGLSVSDDDGMTWTSLRVLGYTSGAPENIASFGPSSAIYQVFQESSFVTRDGRTWRALPPLPAGHYRGILACTSARVVVKVRHVKAGTHLHPYVGYIHVASGGLLYPYLDFINKGSSPCYLEGVPNVQGLNGQTKYVGPAASRESDTNGGDFVVLKAGGGSANVPLSLDSPSTVRPRSACVAREALGLRINFGSPALFRLSLKADPISLCTKSINLGVSTVRLGLGKS
jgi:photosystem II stability/assembly factor-like uncharacterized protein